VFVRWKRRRLKVLKDYTLLSAVLVACERQDGKPRQRIVAHLGSISTNRVAYYDYRASFWRKVDERLDALGLDAALRRKLVAAVAARVKRPTRREQEKRRRYEEERKRQAHEWLRKWHEQHGEA
jgi:hypothetical protein